MRVCLPETAHLIVSQAGDVVGRDRCHQPEPAAENSKWWGKESIRKAWKDALVSQCPLSSAIVSRRTAGGGQTFCSKLRSCYSSCYLTCSILNELATGHESTTVQKPCSPNASATKKKPKTLKHGGAQQPFKKTGVKPPLICKCVYVHKLDTI